MIAECPNPGLARHDSPIRRATERSDGAIVFERFCRRGNHRRPEWHIENILEDGRLRLLGKSGRKAYKAFCEAGFSSDHDLTMKSLFRLKRETLTFRRDKKLYSGHGKHQCFGSVWMRENVDFKGDECLLLPNNQPRVPSEVRYNFRRMTAARAMLIMTQGLPDNPEQQAQHTCGNGHMSCVNPDHLKWGTRRQNAQDASLHNRRQMQRLEVSQKDVDAIRSSSKLCNVIAWESGIPAVLVDEIRREE